MQSNPQTFNELITSIRNDDVDEIILNPKFSYKKIDGTSDPTYNELTSTYNPIHLKRKLKISSPSIPVIIDFNDMKHSWLTIIDEINPELDDEGEIDMTEGCGILYLENVILKNMKGIILNSTFAHLVCDNVKFDSCTYNYNDSIAADDEINLASCVTVNFGEVNFSECDFINCSAYGSGNNPEPGLIVISEEEVPPTFYKNKV
jgi:hypothetical protein